MLMYFPPPDHCADSQMGSSNIFNLKMALGNRSVCLLNFMAIHPNVNLMLARRNREIATVSRIHYQGSVNAWTQFHSTPFKTCSGVSVNRPPAWLKTSVSSTSQHHFLCLSFTQTVSLDEILILGEFLSGPRVARDPAGEGGGFPGCKIQLSSGWACPLWAVGERLPVPSMWQGS